MLFVRIEPDSKKNEGNKIVCVGICSPQEEVEKMTRQRQTLVARFRQEMSGDDITRHLVGHLGSDQEVFLEEHMRQFKEVATTIRQNLTAQDNILL